MIGSTFWVNEKCRLLRNIKAGKFRVFIGPLVDFFLVLIILAILGMNEQKLYLDASTALIIIFLSFIYLGYSFIRGIKEMYIYKNIHNIAIIKNANSFTLIRPCEDNGIEYLKRNIEKIIAKNNYGGYDIFKYDNCKLLKETKNYFDFEGNNENDATKWSRKI